MEMSLLTLIRLTTGDGWADVMNKASVTASDYRRQDVYLPNVADALRKWNSTAPDKKRLREAYLEQARSLLPGCSTDEELNFLREQRLVDCSAEEDEPFETACVSSCGSVYSLLFIPIYIFLSQTSVINLTIAVLIVNLRKLGKKVGKSGKVMLFQSLTPPLHPSIFVYLAHFTRSLLSVPPSLPSDTSLPPSLHSDTSLPPSVPSHPPAISQVCGLSGENHETPQLREASTSLRDLDGRSILILCAGGGGVCIYDVC